MMDLHNYPLDSQNCTVEIESCIYKEYKFIILIALIITILRWIYKFRSKY